MFKISNKTFYHRHKVEIEKYLENKNSLHILNVDSVNKIINAESDKLFLDLNDSKNVPTLDKNKKYDRILLTDVIENHDDVFTLLSTITEALSDDGKLIISSINSKYSIIFKFFEYLKIKDSNKNNSYIHLKKIKNITNGLGLEYQKFYTKQFFPFKLFFLGGIINRMLEVLFFPFNLGIKTYMIFRPLNRKGKKLTKSIIIPAKNEEGNLKELVSRIPKFDNTEIIFSYGQSEDRTLEVMNEITDMYSNFLFKDPH